MEKRDANETETHMAKQGCSHAARVGEKGRVTLSEEVRRHLGVEPGDVVMIELTEGGTAELIPVALIPKDQLWFAHPEVQQRVREANEDVAEGRTRRVRNASELRTTLARLKRAGRSD
jgi:antitoxin MazE